MKKFLKTVIVSIVLVLLATPVSAITYKQLEDNMIKKCRHQTANLWGNTSGFYYCSLLQLITFKKVMRYYDEHRNLINGLINKHWDDKYNTSDWSKVLDELEIELKVMETPSKVMEMETIPNGPNDR